MKMTILRAQHEWEMDVDLEHQTDIPNMDSDAYGITMYGEETAEGELYYVVLDRDAVQAIQNMELPPPKPGDWK